MHRVSKFFRGFTNKFIYAPILGGSTFRVGDERAIRELTEDACRIAEAAAGLEPAQVEKELIGYVAGRLRARFHTRAAHATDEAFRETRKASLADERQAVVDRAADELLNEAERVAASEPARDARKHQAEAEVDEQRERVSTLPLIEKVKTGWPLAIIAMAATSAGIGTLARLSLESVSDSSARNLVTVAAIGGAFASELLIGTLGAEAYDRIPVERRRRVLCAVLLLIFVVLVGTEVFAAVARQQGVDQTNTFTIDPLTGQPKTSGGLTPSLLWTAPLAVLVTLGGSGVVGVSRLREASKPVRDGLAIARARLAEARRERREAEARVKKLRERSDTERERAATLRGESEGAKAQSERLLGMLDQLSQRHAELVAAITAEAVLRYRIAAENLAREGKRRQQAPASERARRLPALLGVAGLAGVVASMATASLSAGFAVGSLILITTTLGMV